MEAWLTERRPSAEGEVPPSHLCVFFHIQKIISKRILKTAASVLDTAAASKQRGDLTLILIGCLQAQNGEESAIRRAGQELYEAVFKYYTYKQWDKWPAQLDASVLARIPVRTNTDDRYFSDTMQALPARGYTRIFENMILGNDKIDVRLNFDYFEMKEKLPKHELLVFTGPIDAYYASLGMPKLEYRSLTFEKEYHEPEGGFYQEALQVRYPLFLTLTHEPAHEHTGES